MSGTYFRPVAQSDSSPPPGALALAGGPVWFDRAEVLSRTEPPRLIAASDIPQDIRDRLTAKRAAIEGFDWARPGLMGVLNVTPDSFSDGGKFVRADLAVAQAMTMVREGAGVIDVGGESTRPGAEPVAAEQEIARVVPVISALRAGGLRLPISVDTRKPEVARAAIAAGGSIWNDVTALTWAEDSTAAAAALGVPVILMHSGGDPRHMQDDPRYKDVVLDVYDHLEARIAACERAGIPRSRLIADPGIGFGKTLAHNLALIRSLSLFHGLGCPLLLGVSRKRFIGMLSGEADAGARAPGSIAAGLEGLRQGVQILRVHDMAATAQALAVWRGLLARQA